MTKRDLQTALHVERQEASRLRAENVRLRAATKRLLDQANVDGGLGRTLAFEDALRALEAAYYGPTPSEGTTEEKVDG